MIYTTCMNMKNTNIEASIIERYRQGKIALREAAKRLKLRQIEAMALLLIGALSVAPAKGDKSMTLDPTTMLWYDSPGTEFCHALPLGNGRMGFTVFGGADEEQIVLNEESVWSGSSFDDNRPDAHQNLPEIRRLLLEGKNTEAETLVNRTFTCKGQGSGHGNGANVPFGCYQTLGTLRLKFEGLEGDIVDYRRSLDLAQAISTVEYSKGDVKQTREAFVSAPHQVGVIRCSSDKKNALTVEISMDRPERFSTLVQDGDLLMTGTLTNGQGGEGVSYAARLRVRNQGGRVTAGDTSLKIKDADAIVLLFDAETDYAGNVPRERKVKDPVTKTEQVLDAAAGVSYEALRAAHIEEHRKWFGRVSIRLDDGQKGSQECGTQTTDRRLVAIKKGASDPAMAALYFNYGRYLLIGSSRPGTLPANLQGIWAEGIQTPWNCDWHLDINVQMNYWPAEQAGLSECHGPMLHLIESLQSPGRKTAQAYYDADGWVAHVITNPWGFTAPGESASWGSTVSGSAWLCEHLWEHYAFTGERDYLSWAYPILKRSAVFYLDMLIEEPKHGWLVTAPSNSPENAFITPGGQRVHTCMGPTMDMQLLRELFEHCIQAATILAQDETFCEKLAETHKRLAPNQIGPDGRLQEWLEPYGEAEPHHRHVSPLYGLHPYDEISVDKTPELAEACRKLLESRGDAATGWSLAWKMNLWSRLRDGNRAEKLFRDLLNPTGSMGFNYTGGGSGSYANLFCAHPPFQIDGNFGGAAGIAEMLLQSRWSGDPNDPLELFLLPALPDAWPQGEVAGLRARGGCGVDMLWKKGKLQSARLLPNRDGQARLSYAGKTVVVDLKEGEERVVDQRSFRPPA